MQFLDEYSHDSTGTMIVLRPLLVVTLDKTFTHLKEFFTDKAFYWSVLCNKISIHFLKSLDPHLCTEDSCDL